MKKRLVILLFILIPSFFSFCVAQYVRPGDNNTSSSPGTPTPVKPPGPMDNFSIGGGFGLQFGDVTFVELEPLLNYHFNQSFMVGIGPIYQYENVDGSFSGTGYGYSASSYGARILAMFFLPDELSRVFLMGEYDLLNIPEQNIFPPFQLDRGTIGLPMAGIGYKEPVSDKTFFYIYGLWNFNNSIYNPYSNPIINVGFDFGL